MSAGVGRWSEFGARLRHVAEPRSWAVDANDGVIATAGLLEGFAGAGSDDPVLMTAATAMLIAGSLSIAGAKWSEAAAARDAEQTLIAQEQAEIAADPIHEVYELTAYWEGKGLQPETARHVAEQLSAKDALAAQLEYEHGISVPTPSWEPRWTAAAAGIAFLLGAAVPLLVTRLVPGPMEVWAILAAALISLSLTAMVVARTSRIPVSRMLLRSLAVGVGTMALSYIAGLVLL